MPTEVLHHSRMSERVLPSLTMSVFTRKSPHPGLSVQSDVAEMMQSIRKARPEGSRPNVLQRKSTTS